MYTDMIGRRDPKSTDGVTSDDDEVENCNGWDGILRRVVIGVPANCSEKKRDATRRAAHSAGFSEVRWGAFISFSHRVQLYDIIPSFPLSYLFSAFLILLLYFVTLLHS